jgi:hypothetical protein
MVFQSPTGIEKNRKVQLVLAAIMIAVACGFFIYTRVITPSKGVVDGVYRNGCCGDIAIKDGRISQGNKTFPLKIRNMKFGLTGYVNGRFANEGMRESDKETAITFFSEGGKRALSLPIDGRDYTFRSAAKWAQVCD